MTPTRSTTRCRWRIVAGNGAGRGSRKPCAAMATRRAWARERERVAAVMPRVTTRSLVGVDEPLAHGVHRRLHARVHLQLVQDVADVVAHGVLGDEQLARDLAV